jgi:ribosome-binding factor A
MKTPRPFSKVSSIKTAQKESAIFRIISPLFDEAIRENPDLQGWHVSRVELSPGKAVAYVYVYTHHEKHDFKTTLETIKLYKPSMRKALADELQKKYTPDIIFTFDEQLQRTLHMEQLLDSVKEEEEEEE